MKIAIYPGSFSPWHEGHADVLRKAIKAFDKVIVAIGVNPDKQPGDAWFRADERFSRQEQAMRYLNSQLGGKFPKSKFSVDYFDGLLLDFVKKHKASAVIKGLRNFQDLEFEKAQQYWSEDLGMKTPIVYVIADRNLTHVSSSAIKAVSKFRRKK